MQLKRVIRFLLGIKTKRKEKAVNIYIGKKQMECVLAWENLNNDLIVRSQFNRELYYKYLKSITK